MIIQKSTGYFVMESILKVMDNLLTVPVTRNQPPFFKKYQAYNEDSVPTFNLARSLKLCCIYSPYCELNVQNIVNLL